MMMDHSRRVPFRCQAAAIRRAFCRWWVAGAAVLLISGCGNGANPGSLPTMALQDAGADVPSADESSAETVAGVDRKIIYEAQVELVVDDVSTVEKQVPRLVKEHGGYLAQVSVDRMSGVRRSGTWRARIPVERFEDFLNALPELGIPERRSQTAQDVTEEYVDLQARITNKQRLEQRILELLEKSDETIKDVLEVERELARVRGEIEQMEGRLRLLANRTEMTTVAIFAREERDYVPPEAPTFLV